MTYTSAQMQIERLTEPNGGIGAKMRTYTLTVRDECGDWGDAPSIKASSPAVAMRRAWEYVESNIGNGDYGQEENGGARVRVYVEIRAGNGPTHEKSRDIDRQRYAHCPRGRPYSPWQGLAMTRALSYLVILIDLALARLAWASIQRREK